MKSESDRAFRHDINGLRAVAVIVVVLFHFQIPGFDAGYLGVDMFFVISGFLMAAILLRGLEGGSAGGASIIWSFYLARARRIMPALIVLVAVLLFVGWWTLSPADYEQLAKHARYAVGFSSNYQFQSEAGYFDVASHEKWLLHTWSLSVEWQFYLLLPVLFFIMWRMRQNRVWLTGAVVALFGLSLAVSLSLIQRSPSEAFYLLPARAWELLAGVFVYLVSDRVEWSESTRRVLEVVGLALIATALILFNENTPWPGSAALVPVLGTGLVLLAMRHTPGWATPKPVQWLGKVSYSLYLWHWPAFVALIFLGLRNAPTANAAAIGVALVLAGISYRWVEQPSRRWLTHARHEAAVAALLLPAVLVVTFAFWVKAEGGVEDRMPPRFERIMAEAGNSNPHRSECHAGPGWDDLPWCNLGGDEIQAVVIGDSHAASIATAVQKAATDSPEEGVIYASYSSCETLFNALKPRKRVECPRFNKFVQQRITNVPSDVPVVVANRLSYGAFGSHLPHDSKHGVPAVYFGEKPLDAPNKAFLEDFREAVIGSACTLARERPVYWLRPLPEMPADVPRRYARQTLMWGGMASGVRLRRSAYEERHSLVTDALQEAEERCSNVHMLDPAPILCDKDYCYGTRDGFPLYYDEHHLSERGNQELIPLFRDALQ